MLQLMAEERIGSRMRDAARMARAREDALFDGAVSQARLN